MFTQAAIMFTQAAYTQAAIMFIIIDNHVLM